MDFGSRIQKGFYFLFWVVIENSFENDNKSRYPFENQYGARIRLLIVRKMFIRGGVRRLRPLRPREYFTCKRYSFSEI